MKRLVIFDIDGVLIDSTESFRRTAVEVIEMFTGESTTFERIAAIKNEGGYNDDTDIVLRLVHEAGLTDVTREEILRAGERLFIGESGAWDGLILRERWLPAEGLLDRLAQRAELAVFTGRGPRTASHSLERFAAHVRFDPVITSSHVENQKPAPDGLLKILESKTDVDPVFVGDMVDDARAARAAGVSFIGVTAADAPHRRATVDLLLAEGARTVVESVNQIEELI